MHPCMKARARSITHAKCNTRDPPLEDATDSERATGFIAIIARKTGPPFFGPDLHVAMNSALVTAAADIAGPPTPHSCHLARICGPGRIGTLH